MITVYGENRTIEEVRRIPLETPVNAGRVWKGIPHGDLVDTLTRDMDGRGWNIGESRFSVNKDGADLVGAFDLTIPNVDSPEGTQFALGLRSDNARHHALRLYVGATVTICSNGMATGQIVLTRRHTSRFRLVEAVEYALDDYMMAARSMGSVVDGWKECELSQPRYEHILLEAGREGYIAWSKLGDVDREYRKPRFAEIGTGTSWALLNAFTWVLKGTSPRLQMDRINGFRQMLPTNGDVIDAESVALAS